MAARFTVTAAAVAAVAAIAAIAVVAATDHRQEPEPPRAAIPSGGACAGRGPAVDLHPVTPVSPPARWVFGPDVVVDRTTGRATIAFAAAPRSSTPTTSLWSKSLPASRANRQRISSGEKGWYPVPYNGLFQEEERPDSLGIDAAGNQTALWREGTPAIRWRVLDRLVDR